VWMPTLYKARGVPVKRPVCAICVERTRGATRRVELGYGVSVWLCEGHADSVRKYLVEKHGIDSAGWFRSRKVAAVGFGTRVPRLLDPPSTQLPPRRVEIILFTPQT